MQELIAITRQSINGAEVNSVNARELYELLEVKSKPTDWIKRAIDKYDFIEGVDFITVLGKSTGGRPKNEVIVTLDMAKELAMMENNPKGKEFRKYFIEVEKQANNLPMQSYHQHIQALAKGYIEIESTVKNVVKDIDDIKNNARLTSQQEYKLITLKNQLAEDMAKRHDLKRNVVHRRYWSLFKKNFALPRYNELPTGKFNDGVTFLQNITLADLVG